MRDIVERLRDWPADKAGRDMLDAGSVAGLMKQAADEISRLRSLTTWRPIETAPKDGTQFWGLIDDDAIAMLWHEKFKAFVSDWRRMTMAPGYTFQAKDSDEWVTEHDHSPTTHEPKWWIPMLPPPPETKT